MKTIKFNADKLGAKVLKFKDGKEYVCLPFKASYIDKFARKDGSVGITINLTEIDLKEPKKSEYSENFEDIGFLKQNIKKEVFDTLNEEQKKLIPICGNVSRYIKSEVEATEVEQDFGDLPEQNDDSDIPF